MFSRAWGDCCHRAHDQRRWDWVGTHDIREFKHRIYAAVVVYYEARTQLARANIGECVTTRNS
jgi:hypothetical protein